MKAEEIRELNPEEMISKEEEIKEEFFNLKVQLATGKLENPMKLRSLRRDIALIKTIIKETEAAAKTASKN